MIKICAICGKEFDAKNSRYRVCSKTHKFNCVICGTEFDQDSNSLQQTCSPVCKKKLISNSNIASAPQGRVKARRTMVERYGYEDAGNRPEAHAKRKQTNIERYGAEHIFQSEAIKSKIRDTMIERYGVENPMQNSDIQERAKATSLDVYGTEFATQSEVIKSKTKQTNIERYGVDNPSKSREIKDKIIAVNQERYGARSFTATPEGQEAVKRTNRKKYGVDYSFQSESVKENYRRSSMNHWGTTYPMQHPTVKQHVSDTCMGRYGVPWFCLTDKCVNAGGMRISKLNLLISGKLKELNIEHELEYVIGSKVFDIHIPKQNTVIEINPTYTHNAHGNHWGTPGYGIEYHIHRTLLANEHGLNCIHIWDWDSIDKVLSLLVNKDRIFARNCYIQEIDINTTKWFIDKYHLQGNCRGQKINLGLYHQGQLIQVMTFGKPRYNKNYEWELLRLCTDSRYSIIGGASKLLNQFITKVDPKSIISYCDSSKFSGVVYTKIGMELKDRGTPNVVWSKGNSKITDNLLRQRGFDQLFGTSHGKGTDNRELMLAAGWLPVYDCGQSVYVWNKN